MSVEDLKQLMQEIKELTEKKQVVEREVLALIKVKLQENINRSY